MYNAFEPFLMLHNKYYFSKVKPQGGAIPKIRYLSIAFQFGNIEIKP
jgi:hypothetical protein